MWCSTHWRGKQALALATGCALQLGLLPTAFGNEDVVATRHGPGLVAPPAGSHPQLPGSRLQGEATMRFFGLKVYHARLWTLPAFRATQAGEQPLVLELEYLRDLRGVSIAERSLQEMRRHPRFNDTQAPRWLAEMQRLFPDVKSGDRLTGLHLPGQGARFWHNGRATGQVDDAEFAQLFFGIWLAPTTSEPDLRLALLGLDPQRSR